MSDEPPASPLSLATLSLLLPLLVAFGLTPSQQARLLGLSVSALRRAHSRRLPASLSWAQQDRLRLSAEIVAALFTLYSDQTASKWFHRPNRRPPFHGQPPLSFILDGGQPALLATHRLLTGDLSGQFSASPEARAQANTLPQSDFDLGE
ncbi:DUF2384 domain-containing protein [Deinococcus sp. QL22]|uniref:DUF2384 domain-containing protein n=1 Tax=Deinococcus sp. QL22 TaxID=2939437 RepID=UPI002016FBF6|nr:DUF2384 domain-containing protein [Deinococcus sp. QL22]UQN08771.1 DUF2384 domain-containing protein [Deinococcus sp. QL22]